MKRILGTFLLMIILLGVNITYATEEIVESEQPVEEIPEIIEIPKEEIIIVKAKVISIGEVYEEVIGDITDKVQKVKVEIKQGEHKGKKFDATYILSYDIDNKIMAYELSKGNTVFVQITEENGEVQKVIVQDVIRQGHIIWMILIFFASTIAIGRKQGLKAIAGLVVTILAVFFIMIANIYKGYSPVLMSMGTSAFVIVITFIIIAGLNKKSLTAAIGTIGGVLCAGLISFVFGHFAKLSGGQEDAIMLSMSSGNIMFNFRELLFAGIVIAALGACMDVGMSIASALDELKLKNPEMTWKELIKSGMNIGGDVIGTMTNTLILAYVGGALTLILLFMANDMSLTDIINKETMAADAISALAGSIGVLYTVPLTTITYALLNKEKTVYKKKPETITEGKRSLKL